MYVIRDTSSKMIRSKAADSTVSTVMSTVGRDLPVRVDHKQNFAAAFAR